MNRVLFKSASMHWESPLAVRDSLWREFRLNFDPCPLHAKFDGLRARWSGRRIYCNPPYGPLIRKWLERATEAAIAVFLLPARTDTKWFHELVLPQASEIRFIPGRLRFNGVKKDAPFPSMIVVFRKSSFPLPALKEGDA